MLSESSSKSKFQCYRFSYSRSISILFCCTKDVSERLRFREFVRLPWLRFEPSALLPERHCKSNLVYCSSYFYGFSFLFCLPSGGESAVLLTILLEWRAEDGAFWSKSSNSETVIKLDFRLLSSLFYPFFFSYFFAPALLTIPVDSFSLPTSLSASFYVTSISVAVTCSERATCKRIGGKSSFSISSSLLSNLLSSDN